MTSRLAGCAALLAVAVLPLRAQEPPDSLAQDTLVVDTALAPLEEPQEAPDSVAEVPDSLRFHVLPSIPGGAPDVAGSEVRAWDRAALLGHPALTLLELLESVPGLLPLRFGDFGHPAGIVPPGLPGGRVRIFLDGFEAMPLDGSVPDLSRITLGALSEVRVERSAGELLVHLVGLRPDDHRPLSVVEAGTGDLDTNIFRGTFLHPRALRGSIGLSLERIDTRGTAAREPGSLQGLWLRYALHRGDAAGLAFELRRGTADVGFDGIPPAITRTDWVVKGRARLADGLVAEAYTGRSSLSAQADSLTPLDGERRQHGVRLGLEGRGLWARGEGRLLSGPELPSLRLDAAAGASSDAVGGFALDWRSDRWEGRTVSTMGGRAWSRSFRGLSAFGSWESGERGARHFEPRVPIPPPDTTSEGGGQQQEEPDTATVVTHRVTDGTTLRVGGRLAVGPVDVTGAWLRTEVDSVVPLGILSDREGVVTPGDEATGFEVTGRLGLPVPGFALVGSLLQWDEEGVYRPRRIYQGGVDFHDVYKNGSLEVWGGMKVEGRDPMPVPFAEGETLARVPFYQTWNAYVQARILTVRIFIRLDNVFLRGANQDFPDRVLPRTRALYGVRWTLWN